MKKSCVLFHLVALRSSPLRQAQSPSAPERVSRYFVGALNRITNASPLTIFSNGHRPQTPFAFIQCITHKSFGEVFHTRAPFLFLFFLFLKNKQPKTKKAQGQELQMTQIKPQSDEDEQRYVKKTGLG